MKAHTTLPFVDTNIIPDRNAGIGSLLWDLQNPHDPDRDGPPLLDPEFALLDVGVSRAKVATALKTLLVRDLAMDVDYVATERVEAVPYANVTLAGARAEKIRRCLSAIFSSKGANCEVKDWHFVVNCKGKVSSVAYLYRRHGNEVCESYFLGRTFMYSGEPVEFSDPRLNEMLAFDVPKIEARIELEKRRDSDPASQPLPGLATGWKEILWRPVSRNSGSPCRRPMFLNGSRTGRTFCFLEMSSIIIRKVNSPMHSSGSPSAWNPGIL
ncbi:MAG: hypothetical protein M5U12_35095 [Verrucomicrobia bacterium]|nr:hypothetical protein [Verrucomicrobiota bacterium]